MPTEIEPPDLRLQRLFMRAATAVPALALPLARLRFSYLVPFNRRIGMRLRAIDAVTGAITLGLPFRPGNCNAAGTVHGAVILALAESVHGVALAFGLRHEHLGALVFTKQAELKFLKKATSDVFVSCRLEPAVLAAISAQLHVAGKTEIQLQSRVTDAAGVILAELDARYHIRWRSGASTKIQRSRAAADSSRWSES